MKTWGLISGLIIVTAGAWLVWSQRQAAAPAGHRAPVMHTAQAERRNLAVTVESIGEIFPANQVSVKPEVSGRVQTVFVKTGQTVAKGEPLVLLDETDLLTERAAAQTEINGAQVRLEKAQRDFERMDKQFKAKLVSQEDLDNARTTLALARNEAERARSRLQAVEDKLQKVRIVAPFDGTVLDVNVTKGQVVSGATGVSQGTELMSFADLNEMLIRTHINQVDIAKLRLGQTVEIMVDALPGVTLDGKVTLIAPAATVRNGVKGFTVEVLISRTDPRVRPGMNANLRFPVREVEGALSVPLAAVFMEAGESVVYVPTPTGAERRVVQIGVANVDGAEVISGLREGESVLLERPVTAPSQRS